MIRKPLISVIVPVYKVEEYLRECIDSILVQSYRDFELILVNDGSPDECGKICDQYAVMDNRVRVIHQINQGVTRARANGVAAACGEFITFVDGDDTITINALEILISGVREDVDVVLGRHHSAPQLPKGVINYEEYRQMCSTLRIITGGLVAKMYRKQILDASIFDIPAEVKNGEDGIINISIAYRLQRKVYSTNAVIYFYRNNPLSASHVHRTPEMNALYQKYRLAAIPEQDIKRFLPLGLADSLMELWMSSTIHRVYIPSSVYDTHRYLMSIRKYSSLKWSFFAKIHFRTLNPFGRAVIILARRLVVLVRKFKQKLNK